MGPAGVGLYRDPAAGGAPSSAPFGAPMAPESPAEQGTRGGASLFLLGSVGTASAFFSRMRARGPRGRGGRFVQALLLCRRGPMVGAMAPPSAPSMAPWKCLLCRTFPTRRG
jgi:hypothetical protein